MFLKTNAGRAYRCPFCKTVHVAGAWEEVDEVGGCKVIYCKFCFGGRETIGMVEDELQGIKFNHDTILQKKNKGLLHSTQYRPVFELANAGLVRGC